MCYTQKQTTLKTTNRVLILFSALLFGLSIFAQKPSTPEYIEKEMIGYRQKANFKENTQTANYDIVYHRLNWEIDPAVRYISGSVTSYFKAMEESISTLSFDLESTLTVDSIKNTSGLITYNHTNDLLEISLPSNLNLGELDSLTVYYQGEPVASGFGSFEVSTHNDTPVLWTLSEPYGAMEWWPCKQSLSDKIDSLDIYVKTPSDYRTASNGKLMSENSVDDTHTLCHWKHRYPITTYLVAIAVTDYESYSHFATLENDISVEILNYVYPESRATAETQTEYTVDVIETLSELFIPYPFHEEKYGHAQFGWGGGMEHQTMSFMGSFDSSLIVHELAHQWFGNRVTCSSWQDIWVNEGFAVYCEGLVSEKHFPSEWKNWKKNEITQVLRWCKTGSVFVVDTNVNQIFDYGLSYKKGGMLVHMLRTQLGDDAFFEAINQLLIDKSESNGFASATDVKNYLETAADTNLTSFFDNWYYGEGYPEYSIDISHISADSVCFSISQTTTDASVDFYTMKVPLQFIGESESETVKFFHTENGQSFTYIPEFEVESIVFDPEYEIVAPHPATINNSLNTLSVKTNSITISPNPVSDQCLISSEAEVDIVEIELINLMGKTELLVKNISKNSDIYVDMSKYPTGYYILYVKTQDAIVVKQIIKE